MKLLIEISDTLQRLVLWWRMVCVSACIPLRVHFLRIMYHISYILWPRYEMFSRKSARLVERSQFLSHQKLWRAEEGRWVSFTVTMHQLLCTYTSPSVERSASKCMPSSARVAGDARFPVVSVFVCSLYAFWREEQDDEYRCGASKSHGIPPHRCEATLHRGIWAPGWFNG